MKYSQDYIVKRDMHLRPYSEVVDMCNMLLKTYPSMELKVTNTSNSKTANKKADCRSITMLLSYGVGKEEGKTVRIIASGDFDKTALKYCADKIGEVFMRKDEDWETVF